MRWLAFLLFALLLSLPAFAQYSNPSGGGSTSIVSGTTAISGGTAGGVCSDQSNTLTCADACTINESTNTLTCTAFSGTLTGTASLATALAGGAADQVMVQTGAGAGTFRTLPASPQNGPTVTQSLIYDSNTDLFRGQEDTPTPYLSGRTFSYCSMLNMGGTALSCSGAEGTNPASIGTSPIYAADSTTFARGYVKMTTKVGTPTSGDSAGFRSATNTTNTDHAPKFVFTVAAPATITSMRVWAGMISSDIAAVADSTTNTGIRIVAFAYDTGGAADTANWHIVTCTGVGDANSCGNDDTGMAFQASHEYRLILDMPTVSTVYWRIIDITASTTASNSRSATLPAVDLAVGWEVVATTLTGAQREVWIEGTYMERN